MMATLIAFPDGKKKDIIIKTQGFLFVVLVLTTLDCGEGGRGPNNFPLFHQSFAKDINALKFSSEMLTLDAHRKKEKSQFGPIRIISNNLHIKANLWDLY